MEAESRADHFFSIIDDYSNDHHLLRFDLPLPCPPDQPLSGPQCLYPLQSEDRSRPGKRDHFALGHFLFQLRVSCKQPISHTRVLVALYDIIAASSNCDSRDKDLHRSQRHRNSGSSRVGDYCTSPRVARVLRRLVARVDRRACQCEPQGARVCVGENPGPIFG
jgi:hypothetical protein